MDTTLGGYPATRIDLEVPPDLDVDGQRQVFLAQHGPATSEKDLAELHEVLDSIHIEQ